MSNIKRKIWFLLVMIFTVSFLPKPTLSAFNLVKAADSSTVYYLDDLGLRHAFPNEVTYRSWYGNDFSKAITVSPSFLYDYPLGKNITIRSGTYLVKVPSAPEVYAVEPGGLLRHIENPEIAETIYGQNWEKKLVDLPEVFFANYTLGEPLKHTWDIPDGLVYQVKNEEKIYWKENNIIRPFASTQALETNGYSPADVIVAANTYYALSKPITGLDRRVFNPVVSPRQANSDCENENLKAAFIFVVKEGYTAEEVEKIETIKNQVEETFSWATDELAELDTGYPLNIQIDDGYLIRVDEEGNTTLAKDEIAQNFYENNEDIFDFLIIFTNFKMFDNEIADFLPVTNKVSGLGKILIDSAEIYGSSGKLKGIINMEDISKYDISNSHGLNEVTNYVLHEILHQWSGAVEFIDETEQKSKALLRDPDYTHWNYYVGFISPLGGSGWSDNGDGTFTSGVSLMADSSKKKYSDLDLYLMGLLPAREMEPIMYVVPTVAGAIGNTIEGTAKYVDIEQIIEAEGKWWCVE